jgi:hypothetical protein
MKCDLELCRKILLAMEAADACHFPDLPQVPGVDQKTTLYHGDLLTEGGYLHQETTRSVQHGGVVMRISGYYRLTWKAHQFLVGARNEQRWEHFKLEAERGGFGFDFIWNGLMNVAGTAAGTIASNMMQNR